MGFWKVQAIERGYGRTESSEVRTRYLAMAGGTVVEVHDMDLEKSKGAQVAVLTFHHGGNAGYATADNSGRYEIADKKASEVVKELEAAWGWGATPAKPAKETQAALGVLPVGMMG